MKNEIIVYTDGSSKGNPGKGGWGVVIILNGRVFELGGSDPHATNNKMEIQAAIEALESRIIKDVGSEDGIKIYSDSSYLINGITKWVYGWQKNNWRTVDKREVLNKSLWERLLLATRGRKIIWERVAGHAGIELNERCDQIATSFADGEPVTLKTG